MRRTAAATIFLSILVLGPLLPAYPDSPKPTPSEWGNNEAVQWGHSGSNPLHLGGINNPIPPRPQPIEWGNSQPIQIKEPGILLDNSRTGVPSVPSVQGVPGVTNGATYGAISNPFPPNGSFSSRNERIPTIYPEAKLNWPGVPDYPNKPIYKYQIDTVRNLGPNHPKGVVDFSTSDRIKKSLSFTQPH